MDVTCEPGKPCPTCERRIPYPRKPRSPTSGVVSYRVPVDEVDSHNEIVEAAARTVGVWDQPYWKFKLVTAALAGVLADPTEVRSLLHR